MACAQGMVLHEDSFCLADGFEFSDDYEEILNAPFLVAHLSSGEGGDGLVLQGGFTSRSGGDIRLGWIVLEQVGTNRVITHLDTSDNQAGDDPSPTTTTTTTTTTTPRSGECTVGLVLSVGERCTYPGTTDDFWVDDSGSGHFIFFTAGTGIDARNTTINDVTYYFAASKQGDGTWIIEAAG